MHGVTAVVVASLIVALASCSRAAAPPIAPTQSTPQNAPAPISAASISPVALENDRVCKSMHGVPCNALIHMLGPMNAELRKETRACVGETVSVYVSGKWVPEKRYQNLQTGERYGDHCIAVSL